MHAIFLTRETFFNPHKIHLAIAKKSENCCCASFSHFSLILFYTTRFSLMHFRVGQQHDEILACWMLMSWWNSLSSVFHAECVWFSTKNTIPFQYPLFCCFQCVILVLVWIFSGFFKFSNFNWLFQLLTFTCGNDRVVTDARERLTNFYTKCSSPHSSSTHLNDRSQLRISEPFKEINIRLSVCTRRWHNSTFDVFRAKKIYM